MSEWAVAENPGKVGNVQAVIFFILTMLAVLLVAVAVLVGLLTTRRSVSDWHSHIIATTNQLKNHDPATDEDERVVPLTTDLDSVIALEAVAGSAYLRAEELRKLELRGE